MESGENGEGGVQEGKGKADNKKIVLAKGRGRKAVPPGIAS
jgi:hypothetical protein